MSSTGDLKVVAQGDLELVITRGFAAPRDLVFRAYTEPDLVQRWLMGPEGWRLSVCEIDARPGGSHRYVQEGPDGLRMEMTAVYHEVIRPERIVLTQTFVPEWYPGKEHITTLFSEKNGHTTVTITVRYESKEARAMVVQSPMESGMRATYLAMDKLLTELGGKS